MKNKLLLLSFGLLMTTQIIFSQVPSYVPSNGLVGYWPFNGNANDESGNGNNGTVNGATLTTDRFGNSNSAYSFDGVDDFIYNNNWSSLNGNQDFSVNFWLKYLPSTGWMVSFGQPQNSNAFHIGTAFLSSNLYSAFWNFNYNPITNNYPFLNLDSNWMMITVVYNNDSIQQFKNGVLQTTFSSNNLNENLLPGQLNFGKQIGNYDEYFKGQLDDIGIWNRALTQQEITAMYNGVNYSDSCNAVSGSLTQGLVGYWPFCGNANDDSGNGNNGTVNGATLTTDRFGNNNSAYSFNGNSNFISIEDNNMLDLTNTFTISAWYLTNNQNQFEQAILGKGRDANGTGYNLLFNTDNNGLSNNIQIGLNNGITNTGAGIPVSQSNSNGWHNITGTYDGLEIKLYIDGILQMTTPQTLTLLNSTQKLFFGRELLNIPRFFNGKLDDIGIWNRALTQQEITQLYNQNQCFTNITVTDTLVINVGQLSFTNPISYSNNITIAPNPASTQININFNNITDLSGGSIKIINSLGQQVATTPITATGTNTTMQLNTWGGTGMYYVQIVNGQGIVVDVKKIILQ